MKVQILHNDKNCEIKNVYYGENNKLLYSVVYVKDKDGFCERMIRIYADGTVEEQNY